MAQLSKYSLILLPLITGAKSKTNGICLTRNILMEAVEVSENGGGLVEILVQKDSSITLGARVRVVLQVAQTVWL